MMPSPFTVATEDYVISRRLFLYTPGVPKHPWIMPFIEFALSAEGQEIVESVGFISQQVEIEPIKASEKMPPEYARIVGESQGRLSVNFRFRPGSTEIDAKAIRDMDRVVKFLAGPDNRNKQVYLLGFSDSSGAADANLQLSQERAEEVARQMTLRGVPVAAVLGLGDAMPVASNSTKAGQEKNRRVEVWLD
jgi:phosphate transport system substrate-binding protein